jgi:hypothetical protein
MTIITIGNFPTYMPKQELNYVPKNSTVSIEVVYRTARDRRDPVGKIAGWAEKVESRPVPSLQVGDCHAGDTLSVNNNNSLTCLVRVEQLACNTIYTIYRLIINLKPRKTLDNRATRQPN